MVKMKRIKVKCQKKYQLPGTNSLKKIRNIHLLPLSEGAPAVRTLWKRNLHWLKVNLSPGPARPKDLIMVSSLTTVVSSKRWLLLVPRSCKKLFKNLLAVIYQLAFIEVCTTTTKKKKINILVARCSHCKNHFLLSRRLIDFHVCLHSASCFFEPDCCGCGVHSFSA